MIDLLETCNGTYLNHNSKVSQFIAYLMNLLTIIITFIYQVHEEELNNFFNLPCKLGICTRQDTFLIQIFVPVPKRKLIMLIRIFN